MGKNLFDFASSIENSNNNQNEHDALKKVVDKYSGYSKNELENELLKEVNNQKANGYFDYAKIENVAKNFSQYLTPEQTGRLNELLGKIK